MPTWYHLVRSSSDGSWRKPPTSAPQKLTPESIDKNISNLLEKFWLIGKVVEYPF